MFERKFGNKESRWTVRFTTVVGGHARWPTVKQLFFDVSTKMAKFWKKSLNGHATVVGWSRDRRLTVKQFYFDVSAKMAKFWKKIAERSRNSRLRSRRPTVKQLFLDFSTKMAKFWKKSLNGPRDSRRTVPRPSPDCQAFLVLLLHNRLNTAPARLQ